MRTLAILFLPVLSACEAQADNAPSRFSLDIASAETWRGVPQLVCKPTRMDICGADGCETERPTIEVRWEPEGAYQRCDAKGCDSYPPTVSYSGIWTEISLPENGNLTKIASDGSYLEVATLNDVAVIYRGQCEPVGEHLSAVPAESKSN